MSWEVIFPVTWMGVRTNSARNVSRGKNDFCKTYQYSKKKLRKKCQESKDTFRKKCQYSKNGFSQNICTVGMISASIICAVRTIVRNISPIRTTYRSASTVRRI
jgi:hypothetical protein